MADTLKQRTAKGLAWGFVSNGSTQVLNLVFGIVLGWLLTPEEYGVVGVLGVFSLVAGALQAGGFTQGLCNLDRPEHRDNNSVFWFNMSVSVTLYIVLFLCSPLIADLFRTPALVWVSRLVFLSIPISALGIVPNAFMFKNLMVKEGAVIGFVALVISGLVGTVLAFLDYSYWALAWQQLTYNVVSVVLRYVVVPFKPSLHVSFEPVHRMMSFGMKMMLTSILNSLSQQVLTFIFGYKFNMHSVGNYSQANKWNVMASSMLSMTVYQVTQPVMAEVRDDRERALRVLRKMVRFTAFLSFPAMLGLALVANEFILTLLGAKWLVSSDLLRIIAVGSSTTPIFTLLQNTVVSRGRSDIYMYLNVGQLAAQVALALVLAPYGLEVIILAVMVFTWFYLFVCHWAVKAECSGYRLADFVRDTMPFALLAALTMVATYYVTLSIGNMAVLLVARIVVAAAIYAGISYLCRIKVFRDCLQYLKK